MYVHVLAPMYVLRCWSCPEPVTDYNLQGTQLWDGNPMLIRTEPIQELGAQEPLVSFFIILRLLAAS